MTNEELTVLARMADDLINNRRWLIEQRRFNDELMDRVKIAEEDSKKLMAECNRLRESEANALNAEREAICDRDEARKKLGEWVRFINDTIYSALVKAIERKDCRKIVKDAVSAMHKFSKEHPVEIIEGRRRNEHADNHREGRRAVCGERPDGQIY